MGLPSAGVNGVLQPLSWREPRKSPHNSHQGQRFWKDWLKARRKRCPTKSSKMRGRRAGKGCKKVLAIGVLSLIILAVWVGGIAINRIENQQEQQSE